jgi:hypothetical protein
MFGANSFRKTNLTFKPFVMKNLKDMLGRNLMKIRNFINLLHRGRGPLQDPIPPRFRSVMGGPGHPAPQVRPGGRHAA